MKTSISQELTKHEVRLPDKRQVPVTRKHTAREKQHREFFSAEKRAAAENSKTPNRRRRESTVVVFVKVCCACDETFMLNRFDTIVN